ncbi:MAG TPA: hypothetical protein VF523_08505 [Burkholderiales bacterium]
MTEQATAAAQSLTEQPDHLYSAVNESNCNRFGNKPRDRRNCDQHSDLPSRAEAQATSLGEKAASIDQLTSTILQNAESARHANELVITTADIAAKGAAAVGSVG